MSPQLSFILKKPPYSCVDVKTRFIVMPRDSNIIIVKPISLIDCICLTIQLVQFRDYNTQQIITTA